ncbi:MAG TPA: lipoprotein [Noviherbaspirillum sp.]|uniref:LPS translocon maturation chaperone LptM n=1 Tax=Noviherbaspirillum sp. TaxID=1926288 RepID=UPI002D2EEFCF|nr:lipoprotein [Noviherbaspirillum sp.]HYD94283.1 lipoprotein [Noviherbaspirillum sp.]
MKSVLDLSRIAVLSTLAMLAGCGQKGPLYMPAAKPAVATPVPQTPPVTPDTTAPNNN